MNNTYKDSDLKKLKKLELMIFEDFIAICENHNIDYYISSGTALGAVRHGGFIPWDDDIDIAVFRKDYEKLLTILDEELSSKYYVIALEKQEDCFFPFAKICLKNTRFGDWWESQVSFDEGIFIDIFPLDKVPKSRFSRLTYHYRCRLLDHIVINSILRIDSGSKVMNIFHNSLFFILNKLPISIKYWKKLYHNALTKYEDTDTEYVTCYFAQIVDLFFEKDSYYSKSEFEPPKKVKFEHLIVSAPNDIDSVLKKSFNNYMELPPEEERFNHAPEGLDFGDY